MKIIGIIFCVFLHFSASSLSLELSNYSLTCDDEVIEGTFDCIFNGSIDILPIDANGNVVISNVSAVVDGKFTFQIDANSKLKSELKLEIHITEINPASRCVRLGDVVDVMMRIDCECIIDLEAEVISESCLNCANGSIEISTDDLEMPYTIEWKHGAKGPLVENLAPGEYEVQINDNNKCFLADTFIIEAYECSKEDLLIELDSVTCYNDCLGSIAVTGLMSGREIESIMINGEEGSSMDSLCSGQYSVLVELKDRCFYNDTVIFKNPDPIQVILDTVIDQKATTLGSIHVRANGGSGQFYFQLFSNNTKVQVMDSISGNFDDLEAGIYSVMAIDENDCSSTYDSIRVENTLSSHALDASTFRIFPNPARDVLNIENSNNFNDGTMMIIDMMGRQVRTETLHHSIQLSDLNKGMYYLVIRTETGFWRSPFQVIH